MSGLIVLFGSDQLRDRLRNFKVKRPISINYINYIRRDLRPLNPSHNSFYAWNY